MKILVAIANHGTKNRHFLDRVLAAYRAMRHEVTIVVLSDKPKADLSSDIEVLVGAPTSNPWSLPFAHRQLFADRVDEFDLFIYSEDDTLIEERHVEAFVNMSARLPEDEIPGFMRYEVRPSGERSYCSVHSHYRWETESVRSHDGDVFASFTNAHSACYLVTRDQLRKAIDSGGFLVPPHEGDFDMLVSAATDVYTRCGFTRRIAVSRMEDFLLHHLPNVYLDKLGIEPADFDIQLNALKDIAVGKSTGSILLDPGSSLPVAPWGLQCYPRASDNLRGVLGAGASRILSVGCVAGQLERGLFGDAATIVGIPIDSALGAVAQRRNIEMTPPDWRAAIEQLHGRAFDIVLLHDVLHRFPDPAAILRDLRELLARGHNSRIVITMPNLTHYWLRRVVRGTPHILPRSYSDSGMHRPTWSALKRWLQESRLTPDIVAFQAQGRLGAFVKRLPAFGRSLLCQQLIVSARNPDPNSR